MNSAITFLPEDPSDEEVHSVVERSTPWVRFQRGAADSGNGRVYWERYSDIFKEYEEENRLNLVELGAVEKYCWVFDYSMGLEAIKQVLLSICARWPDTVVDLDIGTPMLGDEFRDRLSVDPSWDWWNSQPENDVN